MILGNLITPNSKGQVVIPQKIREQLGIDEESVLQIFSAGGGVVIYPIESVERKIEGKSSYLDVLEATAGSWVGDDWDATAAKRAGIEKNKTEKAKKTW